MATSTSPRDVVVLEPLEPAPDPSKKSTIIFLHGLGDDGLGTGYGLAQKFQIYKKLPYTKWILPTAPVDPAVGQRCWYKPHALPSTAQDLGNGKADEAEAEAEDEEGILATVAYIDTLVADEVEQGGVPPNRVVVGGFSQGCAVSTIWGLKGEWRDKVAGVCGLSGYFPNILLSEGTSTAPEWFFGHGMADPLVSIQLFAEGQKRLQDIVDREKIDGHVYDDLAHDIGGAEIRDTWLWLKKVLQEGE